MKHVLALIRFTRRYFGPAALFATVLFCAAPLGLGLATRALFDAFTSGPRAPGAWTALAVVVAVQVGEVVTDLALGRMWSGFSYLTHSLLQRNMLAGVLAGYGEHGLTLAPGDAISRFRNDPVAITMGSMDGVCDLIGRGIFALVAAVVMWRIDPVLALAAFAPVVAAALVSDALGSRGAHYGAEALGSSSELSRFLGEAVDAQLAIRVAGAEERVVGRLAAIGEERRRRSVRDRVFSEMVDSMNVHLVHISTGAVLLLGAGKLRSGSFTVGDFAMFVVFLDQLTYLPAEIGRVVTEAKRTRVSIARMHALMPSAPVDDVVAPAPLVAPAPVLPARSRLSQVSAEGLTCLHRSSGRGVRDVSFTLERGSFTVVTGRVGAGKTTLLHGLLGLLPLDSGSVRWNGETVDPAVFLVPPRCAFTPQVPRLFSEALRDNLVLGRVPSGAALDGAVRAAVLEDDLVELEDGLDTVVGPRGVKLSGGQRQRAAAARMFLGDAELLVFDDVSSALDARTEAELWRRLFARSDGATCLAVSHSPVALARADQVLVVEDGRVRPA